MQPVAPDSIMPTLDYETPPPERPPGTARRVIVAGCFGLLTLGMIERVFRVATEWPATLPTWLYALTIAFHVFIIGVMAQLTWRAARGER